MFAVAVSKIYYDLNDLGSLGGVERLLRRAEQLNFPGATRQTVNDYLWSEQAYRLQKPARCRFTNNRTYVAGNYAPWQADLADMQSIPKQNGAMSYPVTVINVFSKFALAIPVDSNNAKAIKATFGKVLITANRGHPQRLQTDKGKEFFNSDFQALMKRHGILHLASESEQKAAVVMRFNRTIKTRI